MEAVKVQIMVQFRHFNSKVLLQMQLLQLIIMNNNIKYSNKSIMS